MVTLLRGYTDSGQHQHDTGINPFAYLADVIPRAQDHPKRRLDELLPGAWARAQGNV